MILANKIKCYSFINIIKCCNISEAIRMHALNTLCAVRGDALLRHTISQYSFSSITIHHTGPEIFDLPQYNLCKWICSMSWNMYDVRRTRAHTHSHTLSHTHIGWRLRPRGIWVHYENACFALYVYLMYIVRGMIKCHCTLVAWHAFVVANANRYKKTGQNATSIDLNDYYRKPNFASKYEIDYFSIRRLYKL